MKQPKWLICIRCGRTDRPSKYNVGTQVVMRCKDCANTVIGDGAHAMLCRGCCPTGHGTRYNVQEPEDRINRHMDRY